MQILISNSDDPYLKDITMEVQEFKSSITSEEEENKANYEDILSKAKLEESVDSLQACLKTFLEKIKFLEEKMLAANHFLSQENSTLWLRRGKLKYVKNFKFWGRTRHLC